MSQANLKLFVDEPVEGNPLNNEPSGGFARTGRQAWFEVLSQAGREFERAQQMNTSVTHVLMCAYFPGAHPRMRLSTGEVDAPTRVFNVESVVNDREQNRFLIWACVEVF